jgi:glycosyltransferase involved in cell wall biosynthesis
VAHGVNGLLCRAESAEDLAEKMLTLAAMSHSERQRMGMQGRLRAEQEFDERVVLEIYRQAIQSALQTGACQ